MKLYTLNYNNYTNRICKSEHSLADYLAAAANAYVEEDIVNFNYADNITTKQVLLNYNLSTDPDYAILTDDEGNIESRWFVTEAIYNSKFQYTVSLLRDVLVDYPDWKDAIGKVHRGWINSISNPLIFQHEGAGYNQIKTKQSLLYDGTNTPWVVAYITDQFSGEQTISVPAAYDEAITDKTFEEFAAEHLNGVLTNVQYAAATVAVNFDPTIGQYTQMAFPNRLHTWKQTQYNDFKDQPYEQSTKFQSNYVQLYKVDDNVFDMEVLENFANGNMATTMAQRRISNDTAINNFKKYDGKIVKFSDNVIKKISISIDDYESEETITNLSERAELRSEFNAINYGYTVTENGNPYTFEFQCDKLTYRYEDVGSGTFTFTIPADHTHTTDATLDVITFPLGNGFRIRTSGYNIVTVQNNVSLAIGNALGANSAVQDVQILPYCPIPQIGSDTTTLSGFDSNSYVNILNGSTIVNTLFFLPSCSFVKTIQNTMNLTQVGNSITDTKVAFDTKFCRLCGPNYTSVYEFNPVLNRTDTTVQCVRSFTITATYKPFTPYIKIVPEFGGLYGRNFKDNRGLILSGSFSLDRISNAANNFYTTNKNFQNIFDREIQSLELQNKIGREQDIAALVTGTLQGAGVGSVMGKALGTTGAAIGAAIGGGASLAAGIMDLNNNAKLRADALDSRNDMFQFQIGNIMATPSTLAQSTSFNIDNLYVPFVELYDATAMEKQLLIQKMDYYGMTINVVDKISNYIEDKKWIAATPLILNGNYDMHTAETIKNELTTGVYVWA